MRSLLQTLSILILICLSTGLQAQSDRYLHFDGNDDFAELPNASQYFTGASGLSMTGWFCSDGLGYGHGYFGFRGPGTNQGEMYVIELGSGKLECRYISTAGFNEYVSPNFTVVPQSWQHVAWVYDGSNSILYINGVLVGSTPSGGVFTSTNRSFGIGKSILTGFNFVFGGRIDEVSVWRKGLTQDEIQDIMANELTGTEADLELYYKMNQGVPGGDNTGITQLTSEIGGGTRDANLINFTLNGATSNFNISDLDPSFTVTDFCAGSPNAAIITGLPGGTFTFNNPPADGATIDPITGSITGGVAGTTYDIRYTTLGDCAPHEIHQVTVFAEDDPSFTLSDFCIGSTNTATDIITPGGTFSFAPDPLDGSSIDPFTGELTNVIAGSSYTVEYLTNGPCPQSSTETASIHEVPSIIDLTEECSPDQTTYTVTFEITGGDPSTYIIAGTGTLDGSTFTSDPILTGDPYVFIVSDANACGTYEVNGFVACACPTSATFSGDIAICEGTEGEIEITLTGEGPWSIDYTIDGVPQPTIIANSDFYIQPVSVGGIYEFSTVTDFNCTGDISDTEPVVVEVIPTPTASISGDAEICQGESTSFEVVLTGEAPWTMTYAIDGVDEATVTIVTSPYTITADEEGAYSIEVLTDEQCEGTGEGIANLEVHAIPAASISGNQYFCAGSLATIPVNLTGNPGYDLSYTIDGVLQPPLVIGATSVFDLITDQAGTYELVSLNDANCDGTVFGEIVLTEEAVPTAVLQAGAYTICEGSSQEVGITLTGSPNWTVTYSIDGVVQSPLNTFTSPLIFDVTANGTYEIVSVDDGICSNQGGNEQVTIGYYPPISINYSEDVGICIGEIAGVWATAFGGQGNDYTYTWEDENLVSSFNNQANYALDQTGTVAVTVNEGCDYNQSFNIPINVNQLPPLSISGDLTRCGPGEVILINSTPLSYVGDDCTWTVNGEIIESCGNISQNFDLGSFDVGLSVTSPAGCYNEIMIEDLVQVNLQSEADFVFEPQEVTTTESQVWFTNLSQVADQFYWTFGADASSQEEHPIFDFGTLQGIYPVCLISQNEFGCSDTICRTIRVENDLLVMVPNSFTPDDDGVNDYFFPVVHGIDIHDYLFSIYDRNGNILFETNDVSEGWNGSYREERNFYAADAWYTWKLVVKELGATNKQEFVGTVLMVR